MANLYRVGNQLDEKALTCGAIIETPQGSRQKYTYDPECGAFVFSSLLPEGFCLPLAFGFVPATKGEDGDPLDIMVLTDEPVPIGVMLTVRLLGAIEGKQTEDGKTVRNDRLLGVARHSTRFAQLETMSDLDKSLVQQLKQFWEMSNRAEGATYEVIRSVAPGEAAQLIKRAAAQI